ncbi:MAG: hypothetical protein ACKVUT_15590 [Gaiella sp.]
MQVTQIADGLWWWTTHYGEWGEVVGCAYLEADDAIVLIDPLVPEEPAEADRFWRALDRDVKRASVPVHVLITVYWHVRSARAMVDRYDAKVHAPTGGRGPVARRVGVPPSTYSPGDALPGGVRSFPTVRRSEVAFWIPAHWTLVVGDVVHGAGAGRLRFCPPSWLPEGLHAKLPSAFAPLAELPVGRVLTSHGEPVLRHGRRALRALVAGA